MMNVSQFIHNVTKVRAIRYVPANANAVTIRIETEHGLLEQDLFFGHSTKADGDAARLFYDLGGKEEDVVRPEDI